MDSQAGPLSHVWLSVTPSKAKGTALADSDFRSLCRYWLGLPLLCDGQVACCPACDEPCDPFGDHFVNCGKHGLSRRHNAVRYEWSQVLGAAVVSHAKEVVARGRKRPADILLLGWDRGRDVCIDFTVTNPLSAENFPLQPGVGKTHLGVAEREKMRLEGPLCAEVNWGFHPVALSPWGGMGPSAKWFLQETCKRVTTDLPLAAHSARVGEVRQGLSITLAREVARQLLLRCRVITAPS